MTIGVSTKFNLQRSVVVSKTCAPRISYQRVPAIQQTSPKTRKRRLSCAFPRPSEEAGILYQLVQNYKHHSVQIKGNVRRKERTEIAELTARCLAAFIAAGTLDLSLDQLAKRVRVSKRMLIHYFGGREVLEQQTLALLEEELRTRFGAESLPAGATLEAAVMALWDQTTAPESRGALRVVMEATRRAWGGSERAREFYGAQQKLWFELLSRFLPDPAAVEELLHLFQGAILVYLVTGDREQGRRTLRRMIRRESGSATMGA